MSVSWAVEPKGIRSPRGGFMPKTGNLMHMCRAVFIAHLCLSLLIGILCLAARYDLGRFFWLFAASMVVSFLGYRLASDYGLSGLTGLAISFGLLLLFVTDQWMKMYSWLAQGNNALLGLGATALLCGTLLLVSTAKFFPLMKLTTLIALLTMASVNLAVDLSHNSFLPQGDSSVQGSSSISNQTGSNHSVIPSPSNVGEELSNPFLEAGQNGLRPRNIAGHDDSGSQTAGERTRGTEKGSG